MRTPPATFAVVTALAAAAATAAMETRFTENGELECIRIGEATFATGGGNLWEAEFIAADSFSGKDAPRQSKA